MQFSGTLDLIWFLQIIHRMFNYESVKNERISWEMKILEKEHTYSFKNYLGLLCKFMISNHEGPLSISRQALSLSFPNLLSKFSWRIISFAKIGSLQVVASLKMYLGSFLPKSVYISIAISNFCRTEFDILAGFEPVGSTENCPTKPIISYFWR